LRKVYVAGNPADAHLLKGLLEGEDIPAQVRGEFLYGVRGEIPITPDTCPSVWVLEDSDYERAVGLVAAFRGSEAPARERGGVWRCECGEENEDPFTECWKCGRSRLPP
jgi:hypothetical protein